MPPASTSNRTPISQKSWHPYPGAQTKFLSCGAFEALYGGAAYPGKTECLVMEGLRQIDNPYYNGAFFRRTYKMLEGADGPIARSKRWFPLYGGKYNETKHVWTFPSGAHFYFNHLENIADLDVYQGDQFQYIAFDELGQFPEAMYLYLFSRCRANPDHKLRCYMRCGTNPGGYFWVKKRFVTSGITNSIGYFVRISNKDIRVEKGHENAISRSFIPATHRDNPNTTKDYIANLNQMDKVTKARLADGDWDIQDDGDQVYPDWSPIENITTDAEFNPDYGEVFWAVDDGYAYGSGKGTESYHPRVILLLQVTPIGGINLFAERYATGEANYDTSINDILGDPHADNPDDRSGWPYPYPEMVFIDSSAVMFKGALMQRGLLVSGSTHPVIEGIKNLRQFIKDGNGMRLLKVHPRCENVIEEMGSIRYGTAQMAGGGDRKPIKADDHGPDCLRYFSWHLRHQYENG